MTTYTTTRILVAALVLGIALAIFPSVHAQTPAGALNLNSDMELGLPGHLGVPGYRPVIDKLLRKYAYRSPDRYYLPRTVKRRHQGGQCLEMPGYPGVLTYRIALADLRIHHNGQVEISFDARMGPDATGRVHPPSACWIDFRAYPNPLVGENNYPMLHGFSYRPGRHWKHFSVRYPVKAQSNFFTVWICAQAAAGQTAQNALYLDNFLVRIVGRRPILPAEAAVMPNRVEPVYTSREAVGLTVRAELAAAANKLNGVVSVRSDLDNSLIRSYPVRLKCVETLPGGRAVYQGHLTALAAPYGSFHCTVAIGQQPLAVVGGRFAVLHPAVSHARFSPGWRIGYNYSPCPIGDVQAPADYRDFCQVRYGSWENGFRVAHEAGMSLQRLWGHWRFLEPVQGQWRTGVMDPVLKMDRKYGLHVIFVLAGDLVVDGDKRWLEKRFAQGLTGWPHYLLKYYRRGMAPTGEVRGYLAIPPSVLAKYLHFVLKHWGNQIHIWECFNEPGVGGFPAAAYLAYLKQVYRTIKKQYPRDLVLGNGVTGDFGINVANWCEALNAVDPHYERYLDGVAFHPYGAAMDYQNGRYGLYTQLLKNIRHFLKIPKPLWETECFFLTDARHPQIPYYLNMERFRADVIQRHILDGLAHHVAGITPFIEHSLIQRAAPAAAPALSPAAVAANSLSWLLKGMRKIAWHPANLYLKEGLFTSAHGQRGLGFVFDLRPAGSNWRLPADRHGVQVLDLFGNPIAPVTRVVHLTYDPHYLVGSPTAIRMLLNPSTIRPVQPVRLMARTFDRNLFIEGHNVSGQPNYAAHIALLPERGLAAPAQMQLSFSPGHDRETLEIQHAIGAGFSRAAALHWRNARAGTKAARHPIQLVPDTGCYHIPMAKQGTLDLTLHHFRGPPSRMAVSATQDALRIAVSVSDQHLDAARTKALWDGDAVEVFIDPHPMAHLDCRWVYEGSKNLDIWQYVFAATPSKNGATQRVINRSRPEPLISHATHTVARTPGGYRLTALIPWSELFSRGNFGQVIGMDVEVDHARAGRVQKESLGNMPGQSYHERLHYPLFHLPAAIIRRYRSELQRRAGQGEQTAVGSFEVYLPSEGNRITLTYASGTTGIRGLPAVWLKQDQHKQLVVKGPLYNRWRHYHFTFTAARSGRVCLELMGPGLPWRGGPWCCWDDVSVHGAAAPWRGGGFEKLDAHGYPSGWWPMYHPDWVRDPAGAATGNCYVMTNAKNRFFQWITVGGDRRVTVRFQAKVMGPPRIFRMP